MYLNEKVLNYVLEDKVEAFDSDGPVRIIKKELGFLYLPTGKIVANDPWNLFRAKEFAITVTPSRYPVAISLACYPNGDKRVALASIKLSDIKPISWTMALTQDQNSGELDDDRFYGYGVDSGVGGFMDKAIIDEISKSDLSIYESIDSQLERTYEHTYSYAAGSVTGKGENEIVVFSSGWGDGCYPSYFGLDVFGKPCVLVTDFMVLD